MALKTYAAVVTGTDRMDQSLRVPASCREGANVRLQREPNNRHDANAIAVYVRARLLWGLWRPWRQIGYIKEDRAASWVERMDCGDYTLVSAKVDSIYAPVGLDRSRLSLRVTFHTVHTIRGRP